MNSLINRFALIHLNDQAMEFALNRPPLITPAHNKR